MSIFNSTVQSIPCHNNNMQQARQCRRLSHDPNQEMLGLLCANLHRSAFSSLAIKRNLTDRESRKWYKNWTLDAHSSEDYDISAQSVSDAINDTDDITDTNFTQ